MERKVSPSGTELPSSAPASRGDGRAASPLEPLAAFRFTYIAFCIFVVTYLFSVQVLEGVLDAHFATQLAQAVEIDPAGGPVIPRIRERVDSAIRTSWWVAPGGVRVDALVVAADGKTLLYTARGPLADPPVPAAPEADAELLPARIQASVVVPHNALAANVLLVAYAASFLTLLFLYTRLQVRRQEERLEGVVAARDALMSRATRIEGELGGVRARLAQVEPARQSQASEIQKLQREREELVAQLHALEEREADLREGEDEEVRSLREEHEALEALLDEALHDVSRRDEEIQDLQRQLKQGGRGSRSSREPAQLERRLRTLYKNLETDDRVVADLVRLGDEAMKLKAEEALKRLSEDSDLTAVRRKVGGLPPQLSIFEMGFGGRGRIYYTRGRARRHRVLLVGTKASQKPDLEYLSRLPRD